MPTIIVEVLVEAYIYLNNDKVTLYTNILSLSSIGTLVTSLYVAKNYSIKVTSDLAIILLSRSSLPLLVLAWKRRKSLIVVRSRGGQPFRRLKSCSGGYIFNQLHYRVSQVISGAEIRFYTKF